MKKSLFILSAALIVASCSKYEQPMEIETSEVKMVSATINAESSDSGTKTTATYDTSDSENPKYKITWNEGDALSVFSTKDNTTYMTKFTAISAGEKTRFNGEVPEGSTISHAIFPYNDKATASGNVVYTSIPSEQNGDFSNIVLAGWEKGTKALVPVENYDLNYQFEAVCGIVKFHFDPARISADEQGVKQTITSISFISDMPISGDAKIDYSGEKLVMSSNPNTTGSNVYNVVTITKPEGFTEIADYYIATFPVYVAASAENLKISIRFETKEGNVAYTSANLSAGTDKHVFAANIVKNIGSVKVTEYLPHGFAEKPFSVSDTKQVYFSRGNLQYQASSGIWRFAPDQWDAQGEIGNETPHKDTKGDEGARATQSEWIDLFPWGHTGWADKDRTYFPYSTYSAESNYCGYAHKGEMKDNYNWGNYCRIVNGDEPDDPGTWRLLTQKEWTHLLCLTASDPGTTDHKYGRYKMVNSDAGSEGESDKERRLIFMKIGVKTGVFIGGKEIIRMGLLLFPDGFTWPSVLADKKPSRNCYSKNTVYFTDDPTDLPTPNHYMAPQYSLTDFVILEQAGCVFLPAAGSRNPTPTVSDFNRGAYYWTTNQAVGEHLALYKANISWGAGGYTKAFSVRLVKDVVPAE